MSSYWAINPGVSFVGVPVMANYKDEIRNNLAAKEFGATDTTPEMRGLARRLARERVCSPLEALPEAKAQIEKKVRERKETKALARKVRKARKARKMSNIAKMRAPTGQPNFTFEVQGGAPGLGKRKS